MKGEKVHPYILLKVLLLFLFFTCLQQETFLTTTDPDTRKQILSFKILPVEREREGERLWENNLFQCSTKQRNEVRIRYLDFRHQSNLAAFMCRSKKKKYPGAGGKLKLTSSVPKSAWQQKSRFYLIRRAARPRALEAGQKKSPAKPDNYKSSQWSPDMSRAKGAITGTPLESA